MRTCKNCVYNYQFVKESDGSILETIIGERCQNRKSPFYDHECDKIVICGQWVERSE